MNIQKNSNQSEYNKKLGAKEIILYSLETLIMVFDIIMSLGSFGMGSVLAGFIFLLSAFLISPFCEKLFRRLPALPLQNSTLARVGTQIICSIVLFIIGAIQLPTSTPETVETGIPVVEETKLETETELTTTTTIGTTTETITTTTTTIPETEATTTTIIETTTIPETKSTITTTTKKETNTSVKTSAQSNLDAFLLALTPETARDEVKKLAKSYGLFVDYRNTGTGIYKYRFANSEKVAETINPEKGSVITASFNALHNNSLEEITYFDEERMIEGIWNSEDGYSMIDYNNPQIIADSSSSQIAVNSFEDVINYQPEISNKDNLLEELFMSVSESTTKNDIISYAEEHDLVYTFSGWGNENLIAYSSDVIKGFGNEGSYILFDYDTNGIITHLTYCEYSYQYKTGYRADYYSESYSYSELVGYYLCSNQKEPIQYDDARSLIDEINNYRT